MTTCEKAERFRALHQRPTPLILPNAWDALSAKFFEKAGFPAIATTSAGIASLFGFPDGQRIPARLMLDMVERIAHSVSVPVTADLESGYATSPETVAAFVKEAVDRGIVGLNIEDSTHDPRRPLAEIGYQTDVLRAIRQVAADADVLLYLNARIDVYLSPGDDASRLDDALRRAHAYRAAGADCLFLMRQNNPAILRRIATETRSPLNLLLTPDAPPLADLPSLGITRISFGPRLHHATLPHLHSLAHTLFTTHTSPLLTQTEFTHASINALFAPIP